MGFAVGFAEGAADFFGDAGKFCLFGHSRPP
jgi:hypothetical protein